MHQLPPEPWKAFLGDLDAALSREVRLHCLGGFVLGTVYQMPRPTADVDVLAVAPIETLKTLTELGGRGAPLHRKHHVYLDYVAVAAYPDDYESRLVEMFAGGMRNLRLFALEAHDLALTKLERNSQRDREDVFFLADTVPLDTLVLAERYRRELRPYLGNPAREDLTLELWIEAIGERRQQRQ